MKIDVFLDACCGECGNYASNDMGFLPEPKKAAKEYLVKRGWKRVKGKNICNYCLTGERRPISR